MPSRSRIVSSCLVLAALAGAPSAGAQLTLADVPLPVGARVRVTAPDVVLERVTGRVHTFDEQGLTLSRDSDRVQLVFAPAQVHVIEVSRGRSRWAWVL